MDLSCGDVGSLVGGWIGLCYTSIIYVLLVVEYVSGRTWMGSCMPTV